MLKKLIAICLLLPALACAEVFEAGKDYEVLSVQNAAAEKGKPQVIEFFSYGCPACFHMEDALENWLKNTGNTVNFERIPVAFNKSWEHYAKAYYTAKTLSMAEKMTPLIFKTINTDKKPLDTNASMVDLFVSQGADKDVVASAFEHSLTVDMMIKEGMTKLAQYQITGIPAFIVNQRYKTDLQMAKTPERMILILDYLIKKEQSKA